MDEKKHDVDVHPPGAQILCRIRGKSVPLPRYARNALSGSKAPRKESPWLHAG